MDKQQEIVQMLWDESFNSTQMRCNFVKSDDFEDLAERIVKLFDLPDVIGQGEQFFCNNERMGVRCVEQCLGCFQFENKD